MDLHRRDVLVLPALLVAERLALAGDLEQKTDRQTMYGLIGKMTAVKGQRDALAAILLESTDGMPGCLSYVVASDPAEPDALWITEVWDRAESHAASLKLPAVQAAIAKGRPLIAGFSDRVETVPMGGVGLPGRGAR